MTVFGIPKSGKTAFCDSAPDVFFASTEPGGQDFVRSPVVQIKSWLNFQELVLEIDKQYKSNALEYKAVVIDIADNLYKLTIAGVCKKKGILYPPANDFGRTWSEVTNDFSKWVSHLKTMIAVRFIMHVSTQSAEFIENGITREKDIFYPSFSSFGGSRGGARQFIDGLASIQGFMATNSRGKHFITFRETETIAAGDRSGILRAISPIELPDDPREDWNYVSKLYRESARKLGYKLRDEM